jgi:hypothetical protein
MLFTHFKVFDRGFQLFLEENNEIIFYLENRNVLHNIFRALLRCSISLNEVAFIKMKIKTDMTFCKRIVELIWLKGVNSFCF